MTHAADERPDRLKQAARSGSPAIGAIAVWLLIQLIVLVLCAARVALWYRAPEPLERLAVEHMLVAQVVASSLLFPWLMRNLMTAACVILTSAPFVLLAGMLAEAGLSSAARAWGYVALWLAGLAACTETLQTRRAKLVGVALAGVLAVGVPLVRYLESEFHALPHAQPAALRWLNPVAGALSQLRPAPGDNAWWVLPFALVAAGIISVSLARSHFRATSYPQD
jgi:hypothetical protein